MLSQIKKAISLGERRWKGWNFVLLLDCINFFQTVNCYFRWILMMTNFLGVLSLKRHDFFKRRSVSLLSRLNSYPGLSWVWQQLGNQIIFFDNLDVGALLFIRLRAASHYLIRLMVLVCKYLKFRASSSVANLRNTL